MGIKINKGVALLIERQKTNPEEFKEGGGTRWESLLTAHDVYLECPERKVLHPRAFNKEVIKRLLTAYDLESKITRAQLLRELLPGLNALFNLEYKEHGKESKDKDNERR